MRLLIGICRTQYRLLRERTSDDLESDGKSRCGKATGDRDTGQPRKVERHGRDILQVHLQGARHLANLIGGGRCGRRHDDINLLKGTREVLLNERPHFECLEIVCVVVAR